MNGQEKDDVCVFTEALQLPTSERSAFLDKVCGANSEQRQRVDALLKAHTKAETFLERLPSEVKDRSFLAGEKPGDRIGRYTLLEQIGEGGCGVVFMARQEEPVRRVVALKLIKLGMDTKNVIARFEAERQALALMDHPNIAHVIDAGATENGRPYFVMELVRGIKITDYCDQNALPTAARLNLFGQVCQAIQHAHQKGIIHRDIKPSNILVGTTPEGTALPKIIDFGIAKATMGQQLTDKTLFTAFEMMIGTPAYMSPEQVAMASVDIDTRSDIYSLGVLLYELLTGRTPFDTSELLKSGLDEVRWVIRNREPYPPSTRLGSMTAVELTTEAQRRRSEPHKLIRSIRGDLDWIVMKALEKDRSRRYETANGLALDVKRYLAGEPIAARPPSAYYRLRKTVSRHKVLFGGAALIVTVLIAGFVIVSASLRKERLAYREAGAALHQSQIDRQKAQIAAAKSQQMTRFLEEMLNRVEPSVARGRDTTMLREMLDETAEQVGKELTNQPAVEAELRSVMGRLYLQIGLYARAETMHRAALAIDRRLYGENGRETAEALNDLGVDLWRQWKQSEAEELLKRALAIRRRLFGNESAELAESLNNLANVYRHDNKPQEAESLATEGLEIRQRVFGKESLEAADSLRVLSILYGDENKPVEAEAAAREVLAIRQKHLPEDDPQIAVSLMDIAWAAGKQGKWEQVEELQREAYSLQRKVLGEAHPTVAETLNNLCATLEGEHKYSDAEEYHRAALKFWTDHAGSDSPNAVEQMKALVHDFIAEKKFVEAEDCLDTALTPAFLSQPESAQYIRLRLDLRARNEKWRDAAADAALLIKYQPNDHFTYHMLAGLEAIAGDKPAYERVCKEMVSQFGDAKDRYIAERVAQDGLLLPDSGVALPVLDKIADTAVGDGQGDMPFADDCKALANYRLGRYADAIQVAKRAQSSSQLHAQAKADAILAMSYWKLGEVEAARRALAAGNSLVLKKMPFRDATDAGQAWMGWIFARVSLDEAEKLVGTDIVPSATGANGNP